LLREKTLGFWVSWIFHIAAALFQPLEKMCWGFIPRTLTIKESISIEYRVKDIVNFTGKYFMALDHSIDPFYQLLQGHFQLKLSSALCVWHF
jgi:hypothetical protein